VAIDIIAAILMIFRVVLGFVLILIVPGLFLSLVFFPRISDLEFMDRLIYTVVLSIGSVLVSVLFMDVALGIDVTPVNIILTIFFVSGIFCILWIIRLYFPEIHIPGNMQDKIVSRFRLKKILGK